MKPLDFYLFVVRVSEANLESYERYILDDETHCSLFFQELGITDLKYLPKEKSYNYGMEMLMPDFRYEFPISEMFKFSVLKKDDLPLVEKFCSEKNIAPNSYMIVYKQDIKLSDDFQLSFPNFYFVGKFTMSEAGMKNEQLANPHLF
ncbi:MAG: hypothetical protein Q4C98_03715 [Capnocytophaga sp.]|nr:hypothetical protein [Capnocytophaga sp.]